MTVKNIDELHDANLVGIAYLPDHEIRIDFRTDKGVDRCLFLRGVKNFYCNEMWSGNIVLSVEIFEAADLDDDDFVQFASAENRGEDPRWLRNLVTDNELVMVSICPSYGAIVGCVCASVRYE
jgi:hypothetical protein